MVLLCAGVSVPDGRQADGAASADKDTTRSAGDPGPGPGAYAPTGVAADARMDVR
jgi:hypothetical protein